MLKNMGNKTAINYGNEKISYGRLIGEIEKTAELYSVKKGSRVGVFMENRPEWIYSFYSIWKNKGIAVPIDHMATANEVAFILKDCRPDVVFTSESNKETLLKATKTADIEPQVIIVDEFASDDNMVFSGNSLSE